MSFRNLDVDRTGPVSVDLQRTVERARALRNETMASMLRGAGRRIAVIMRHASAPTAKTPPWQHRRPLSADAHRAA